MDLAAMLTVSERASEEGVQVLVFPRVPGLSQSGLLDAFLRNAAERAPGLSLLSPALRYTGIGALEPRPTGLGRTLVLWSDDCIDPSFFEQIQRLECDALVWLFDAEDALQAEATLELALDASLRLAPLVIVAASHGRVRGFSFCGVSGIAYLGEIVSEGGSSDDLLVAQVPAPARFPERPRTLPEPAPILLQRLAAHAAQRAEA
jgi:predicted amidohydrolase